jgi:pimeloyl-ACP methyl ester carboxylesterase
MLYQSVLLFLAVALCKEVNNRPIAATASGNGDKCTYIEGKKLFLNIQGTKNPTVVFVSALGEDHANWKVVQEAVSKFATTMSYDRSGLGISEYNQNAKKDAVSMAGELHRLVQDQNIKTPFILVSHSLGCTIARVYASKYPQQISGMVYVDPPPNQDQLKAEAGDLLWNEREKAIKQYTPPMNKAQQEEYTLQHLSFRQADQAVNQPAVPTVLLTATLTYPDFPASALELKVKKDSHAKWLRDVKGAERQFVPESRH